MHCRCMKQNKKTGSDPSCFCLLLNSPPKLGGARSPEQTSDFKIKGGKAKKKEDRERNEDLINDAKKKYGIFGDYYKIGI